NMSSYYQPREVASLGGEVRQALTYTGSAFLMPTYRLTDGNTNRTDTVSLRGNSRPGKWSLDYGAGYASGELRTPSIRTLNLGFRALEGFGFSEPFGPDDLLPGAVDAAEGIIISPYGPSSGSQVPLPLFTAESWARANDASRYYLNQIRVESTEGSNDRYTGN